jgi:hypothetical protein
MERVIQGFFPNKNYKVQIIERKDGHLYTTEAYRWMEDCGYEFWSYISQGLTLIDSEEHARKIAMEQLKECSRDEF